MHYYHHLVIMTSLSFSLYIHSYIDTLCMLMLEPKSFAPYPMRNNRSEVNRHQVHLEICHTHSYISDGSRLRYFHPKPGSAIHSVVERNYCFQHGYRQTEKTKKKAEK